jgi:hypothetical protein
MLKLKRAKKKSTTQTSAKAPKWTGASASPGEGTTLALFPSVVARPKDILMRTVSPRSGKVSLSTGERNESDPTAAIEVPRQLLDKLCRCDSELTLSIAIEYVAAGRVARVYYRPGVPGRFWTALVLLLCTVASGLITLLAPDAVPGSRWAFAAFGLVCLGAVIVFIQQLRSSG